jgi:hypothetical protein
MTNILSQFCREVQDHLEGTKRSEWFYPDYGLCSNAESWADFTDFGAADYIDLRNKMETEFEGEDYPFNNCSLDYENEKKRGAVYQNPLRLAFIKKWAESDG